MAKIWWFILKNLLTLLLVIDCHLMAAAAALGGVQQQQKTEVMMPSASTSSTRVPQSPPEGNTTFLDGTTWCVAAPGVSGPDLQTALDWACGIGSADCKAIQSGGPCYEPDDLVWHASYAFNSYYQQNGNNDIACNFGGTAKVTKEDPSHAECSFPVSGGPVNGATPNAGNLWEGFSSIVILLVYLLR